MQILNGFEEFFCFHSDLSSNDIISAERLGLKMSMDFRGLVWKPVWKMTVFGLKKGQDLKNWVAHPCQEFPGVPTQGHQGHQGQVVKVQLVVLSKNRS